MSSEAVKAGQIIADEFLMRIARRYEHCNVNIYPDMPYLTPVEAVLRCAQEEGFILTNVIPGGPVGGAGELTAALEAALTYLETLTIEHSPDCSYGATNGPHGDFCDCELTARRLKRIRVCDHLHAALAAKAPQGVPPVEAEAVNSTKGNNLVGFNVKVFGVDFGFHGSETPLGRVLAASKLPVPAPVSDDTIHQGMAAKGGKQ